MIDGKNFFDQPINNLKYMKILEKVLLVKGMMTQLVVF